jgi:hypothetical protein
MSPSTNRHPVVLGLLGAETIGFLAILVGFS